MPAAVQTGLEKKSGSPPADEPPVMAQLSPRACANNAGWRVLFHRQNTKTCVQHSEGRSNRGAQVRVAPARASPADIPAHLSGPQPATASATLVARRTKAGHLTKGGFDDPTGLSCGAPSEVASAIHRRPRLSDGFAASPRPSSCAQMAENERPRCGRGQVSNRLEKRLPDSVCG